MKKLIRLHLCLSVLLVGVYSTFGQQNRFNFFLSGGINFPKMDDINQIYQQDLTGYKKVRFAYDLSSGFMFHINSEFSLKLGLNYLHHRQSPPVELINEGDEIEEGKIRYRIYAYCPFLGVHYNLTISSVYRIGVGFNIVRCMGKLVDELPDADTFFEYLHGNSWGGAIESNVLRKINDQLDVGVEFGYRLVNIKKLKIDSSKYEDYSEDIGFTLYGNTVDLDFSGPFIRLFFVFKL